MVETSDGVRLHCERLGDGPGCLIAPGIGNEVDFAPLAERRTVVFFDVRNRGRSDPVPETGAVGLPIEVDDVDTVRRSVGAEVVDVIGWSYIGLVAALYAARYPRHVRRLVLVCPVPLREYPEPSPSPQVLAQLDALRAQDLDPVAYARAWRRIVVPPRMGDPAAFDRLRVDPSTWPNEWPDHLVPAMQRVTASVPPGYDFRPEAAPITAPTLIVAGRSDTVAPLPAAEEWSTTIADARLITLPGVGHFPHVEAPDAFFAAVDSFLRSR